jgi:hypothetical protein
MLPARWRIAASKPENRRPQQNPLKTQLRTWKLVEAVTVQGRSCAVVRLTGLGGDERVQDRMFSYVSFGQRVPANSNRFAGPLLTCRRIVLHRQQAPFLSREHGSAFRATSPQLAAER